MKNTTLVLKTPILFFLALLCAAVASLQTVPAAPITVMNTNDSGTGSLRQALADANDGDTINFGAAVTGTITLTTGELLVNDSITISGPGANVLAVSGNHATRVFRISSGKTVTISGLTIANGSSGGGGGIMNGHATLTVSECTLSGNSANQGGGIENFGEESGSATLSVSNSTLRGNSAANGGGIRSSAQHGGNATVTVSNSTLSGNSAANRGGGIHNDDSDGGNATVTVSNSTLSGNSAANGGGGIENIGTTLTIGGTILNAGALGANIHNSGTVQSLGYNLSSDNGGGFLTGPGDQINTAPMLGPLQDNGGPTFTHALCTASGVPDASCTGASPAIDKGKNFTSATTDQRGSGFARTVDFASIANATGGDGTDIGAFEVQTIICPQGKGYWKNNPDAWPVSALPMTLGSQSYTKPQLLTILNTPVGTGKHADASLILADQLIAAKLNIANGANGTPVSSTITDADAVLSLYSGMLPYRVSPNSTNGQRMVNDAATLDSYNNGLLTPGCTPTPTPTP